MTLVAFVVVFGKNVMEQGLTTIISAKATGDKKTGRLVTFVTDFGGMLLDRRIQITSRLTTS